MKGKIGIESRSGEGAAFRVWLPAAEAEAEAGEGSV
jgi:signal transduction histidine kinase